LDLTLDFYSNGSLDLNLGIFSTCFSQVVLNFQNLTGAMPFSSELN
jgi:hypothetical protein